MIMLKILIFGGTTEGRRLCLALAEEGHTVTLSVATEYGRNIATKTGDLIPGNDRIEIIMGRLDIPEMTALMSHENYDHVIDATHPYAEIVTNNIEVACKTSGTHYIRLKRMESASDTTLIYASDASAAVGILNACNDNALLTIGSKELMHFTKVTNFEQRLHIRILPMRESLETALALGYNASKIICMHGPFTVDMNMATIKMTGAKYLITKDSGDIGGFESKVSAAYELGCKVIVIERPPERNGYTLEELMGFFKLRRNELDVRNIADDMLFFPLFISLKEKDVLIIGGGKIAERRTKALLSYGANVTIIAPDTTDFINNLASNKTIDLHSRKYQSGDIEKHNPFLVIAATNDREVNHSVMEETTSFSIYVSVADSREECTFFFPALAENNDFIAGLVSRTGNHIGVKNTAEKIRSILKYEKNHKDW